MITMTCLYVDVRNSKSEAKLAWLSDSEVCARTQERSLACQTYYASPKLNDLGPAIAYAKAIPRLARDYVAFAPAIRFAGPKSFREAS